MGNFEIALELKNGGEWLAAARSWMQSNIHRGDTLCWSSGELVQIPFCALEGFALRVAAAAVAEDRRKRATPNVELTGAARLYRAASSGTKWSEVERRVGGDGS